MGRCGAFVVGILSAAQSPDCPMTLFASANSPFQSPAKKARYGVQDVRCKGLHYRYLPLAADPGQLPFGQLPGRRQRFLLCSIEGALPLEAGP